MTVPLLRCASGLIRRCANGLLLRCTPAPAGSEQWQTTYTNAGCGTCANGIYPGVWTAGASTLATGSAVSTLNAESVVIDADAGTAVSYGPVWGEGLAPDDTDTDAPTVTHDPCLCTFRYYVTCGRVASCVGDCPNASLIIQNWSTNQICAASVGCAGFAACFRLDDACHNTGDGNCHRFRILAGPFCSIADANAWQADHPELLICP